MNIFKKIKSFFIIKEEKSLDRLFEEHLKIRSELVVSDIKVNEEELNFKVSFRGSIVPFWVSSKYQLADIISIIATGLVFGLNLVEISQALKK